MPGLDPRRPRPTPLLGNSPIGPASAPSLHHFIGAAVWADNIAFLAFGGSKRLGEGPVAGVTEKLVLGHTCLPTAKRSMGTILDAGPGGFNPGTESSSAWLGLEFCMVGSRIFCELWVNCAGSGAGR